LLRIGRREAIVPCAAGKPKYRRREISSARTLAIKIVRLIRPLSAIEASMLIKVLKQARALYEVVWGKTTAVAAP
jgi:hypothetical protein